MEVLPWMEVLCAEEFYGKCTKRHDKIKRSGGHALKAPVFNIFCIDCKEKVCTCCQPEHKGHTLLQIRRASMQDAVLLSDVRKHMDVSDVQVAKINGLTIVYIGHHLSSTYAPIKENDFINCRQKRSVNKNLLGRVPEGNWTYCSIACKIAGLTRKEPRLQTSVRIRTGASASARITQAKPKEDQKDREDREDQEDQEEQEQEQHKAQEIPEDPNCRRSTRKKTVPKRDGAVAPGPQHRKKRAQPKPETSPPPSPPSPAAPLALPSNTAPGVDSDAVHSLSRLTGIAPTPTSAPDSAEKSPVSPSDVPVLTPPPPTQLPAPTPTPVRKTFRLMQQKKRTTAKREQEHAESASALVPAPTPTPNRHDTRVKHVNQGGGASRVLCSKANGLNISMAETSSAVDLLSVEEKAMITNQPGLKPSGGSFAFDPAPFLPLTDLSGATPRAGDGDTNNASPFGPPLGEVDTPGFGYVPSVGGMPAPEPTGPCESPVLTDRTPAFDVSPALLDPPPKYTQNTPPIPMQNLPFKSPGAKKAIQTPAEANAEADAVLAEHQVVAAVAATPVFRTPKVASGCKNGVGCCGSGGGFGFLGLAPTPELDSLPSTAPTPVGDYEAGKAWLSLGVAEVVEEDVENGKAVCRDDSAETPRRAGVNQVVKGGKRQSAPPFKSSSDPGRRKRKTTLPSRSPLSSVQGAQGALGGSIPLSL